MFNQLFINPFAGLFEEGEFNGPNNGLAENIVVFKEEFIGNGSQLQFQLNGNIINGSFGTGIWNPINIRIGFPTHITKQNKKPAYESVILGVGVNRISVLGVTAAGLVTMSAVPRSGENIAIYYWYELQLTDKIENYYREDFVASMEADLTNIQAKIDAQQLQIDNNTTLSHSHANKSILDATQESFTTALKNKLDALNSESYYQQKDITALNPTTGYLNYDIISFTSSAGIFAIFWSYELGNTNKRKTESRVVLDNVSVIQNVVNQSVTNNTFQSETGFVQVNLSAGLHSIKIDYRKAQGAGNAAIRNSRILILKLP